MLTNPISLRNLLAMKRVGLAILIVSLMHPIYISNSLAAVKAGGTCKTQGITKVYAGSTFKCSRTKGKLIWAKVQKSKAVIEAATEQPKDKNPRIGNCYNYSLSQSVLKNIDLLPVNCAQEHSAETYKVAIWNSDLNPYGALDSEIAEVARSICQPFNYKPGTIINNWGFYFPSELEWKQGARWIRCDALSLDNMYKPTKLNTWPGEPPARKATPATCTVESSKGRTWSYSNDEEGEVRTSSFGFYVRNTSPDRDATLVLISIEVTLEDGETAKERVEISRIPAGQMIGAGTISSYSSPIEKWKYSIRCSDSDPGPERQLISTTVQVKPQDPRYKYGAKFVTSLTNTYKDVIRCKNDGYSCLVYVALLDSSGGLMGGATTSINGPVYPGDKISIEGYVDSYPISFLGSNLTRVAIWVQEPQP